MRVAKPTFKTKFSKKNLTKTNPGAPEPNGQPVPQRPAETSTPSIAILLPTADAYRHRAEEAKSLARQSQDVWEREILLRVATQWQLLAAHRDVKDNRQRAAAGNARRG
jgi:hypothetical protein